MQLKAALLSAGIAAAACGPARPSPADEPLEPALRHLRSASPRGWSSFPEQPDATRLELVFSDRHNRTAQTLRLRQQDVKQSWHVVLNDRPLGDLRIDENDMVVYFDVPAG